MAVATRNLSYFEEGIQMTLFFQLQENIIKLSESILRVLPSTPVFNVYTYFNFFAVQLTQRWPRAGMLIFSALHNLRQNAAYFFLRLTVIMGGFPSISISDFINPTSVFCGELERDGLLGSVELKAVTVAVAA